MGLNDNGNNLVMPVGPYYGNGYGNNGFNGNDWWILLFLFAFWGNGNWGNGGANGGGMLPYFAAQNTDAAVQRGFDQSAITGQLAGIQTSLTNGFASAEVANCNRSMANLERSFATQTAVTGAIADLASQQAQCCCENRLANCETRNTIVAESAATRNADLLNTRDIIDNQNRNNQAIIDKLCQLELDGLKSQLSAKDDIIGQLRSQLNVADRERSQSQQTADIIANNAAQSAALRELIAPQIKPAYIVPNPNGCNCGQTYTCGSF